jgi:hypothetical protein
LGGWTNGLNGIPPDKDRGISKLIASIVERGNGMSVVDEQGVHGGTFCTKKLRSPQVWHYTLRP